MWQIFWNTTGEKSQQDYTLIARLWSFVTVTEALFTWGKVGTKWRQFHDEYEKVMEDNFGTKPEAETTPVQIEEWTV